MLSKATEILTKV